MFSIIISVWISDNDNIESEGILFSDSLKALLVGYSAFWGIYFIYMLYLSIMFMAMSERFMKDIL